MTLVHAVPGSRPSPRRPALHLGGLWPALRRAGLGGRALALRRADEAGRAGRRPERRARAQADREEAARRHQPVHDARPGLRHLRSLERERHVDGPGADAAPGWHQQERPVRRDLPLPRARADPEGVRQDGQGHRARGDRSRHRIGRVPGPVLQPGHLHQPARQRRGRGGAPRRPPQRQDPQDRALVVERGLRRDRADPPPARREEGGRGDPPRLAARGLHRRAEPHAQG